MRIELQRRQMLIGTAALLAAPALVAATAKAEVLRLGQSTSLTGQGAQAGGQFSEAARRWFEISANQGPRVELVTLDDGGQVERTLTNAKVLTSSHGVAGFFGFTGAGANRDGMQAAAQEQMPFIAPVSGVESLRQPDNRHVFLLRAGYRDEIRQVIRHLSSTGISRVGLLFEYESAGWEMRDMFTEAVQTAGLAASQLASVSRGSADVAAALPVLTSGGIQAIILAANPAASAAMVRSARAQGFGGSFYTLSTVGGKALLDALGPLAVGLSVTQVVPFPWTGGTPVSREFLAFCTAANLQPDFASMEGYLAARWVSEALRRAKLRELSPESLTQALAAFPAVELAGFPLQFDPASRSMSRFVELTVVSSSLRFRR